MTTRLEHFANASRRQLERRLAERSFEDIAAGAAARGHTLPFAEALARPGTSVIAEFKRRSPSAGAIQEAADVGEVVGAYERGGAAALSIITEEEWGGSLDDLRTARAATGLPILRKHFTVDRRQLHEAKEAGADAVLLVVGSVDTDELGRLHQEAVELDLDALVEVRAAHDLVVALQLEVDVIGINNRDLEDFTVDLACTFELIADVPAGKTVVSESGIGYREQIDALEEAGVDAVLVGEGLMRAPDPEAAVRELARSEEPTQA